MGSDAEIDTEIDTIFCLKIFDFFLFFYGFISLTQLCIQFLNGF